MLGEVVGKYCTRVEEMALQLADVGMQQSTRSIVSKTVRGLIAARPEWQGPADNINAAGPGGNEEPTMTWLRGRLMYVETDHSLLHKPARLAGVQW
jgi:hypothetical protein